MLRHAINDRTRDVASFVPCSMERGDKCVCVVLACACVKCNRGPHMSLAGLALYGHRQEEGSKEVETCFKEGDEISPWPSSLSGHCGYACVCCQTSWRDRSSAHQPLPSVCLYTPAKIVSSECSFCSSGLIIRRRKAQGVYVWLLLVWFRSEMVFLRYLEIKLRCTYSSQCWTPHLNGCPVTPVCVIVYLRLCS